MRYLPQKNLLFCNIFFGMGIIVWNLLKFQLHLQGV